MKMSSVETDGPSTSVSVPIQARLLSRKEAMKGVQKASTVDVHVTSKEKPPCMSYMLYLVSFRSLEILLRIFWTKN